MKLSHLFGTTLRAEAASTGVAGHDLLIRAAYARLNASGIWHSLPSGVTLIERIKQPLCQGIENLGGSELQLAPLVEEPNAALGHYDESVEPSTPFKTNGKTVYLSAKFLQVILTLISKEVHSYRQLPLLIWTQRKAPIFASFTGPGLYNPLSPNLIEAWVIAQSETILHQRMKQLDELTQATFSELKLPYVPVDSDPGIVDSLSASSFVFPTQHGNLSYAAEGDEWKEKSRVRFGIPSTDTPPLPIEKVHTPGTKTIQELAAYLQLQASQTAKVVFYTALQAHTTEDVLVMVLIRGDHEVNEMAVRRAVQASVLRPATDEEILAIGAVPGYASPIGIRRAGVIVLADDAVVQEKNLIAGANEVDYHYAHTQYGRDYEADQIGNFRLAYDGAPGKHGPLVFESGIELAKHILIGSSWPEKTATTFMGDQGKAVPVHLGYCYWNPSQILAALADHHHDEDGLRWPYSVSPYLVQIVSLADSEQSISVADQLYQQMQRAGISVLYDDRHKKIAGPGVKFTDADLRGIPVRITIAKRALKQGGVEWKLRTSEDREVIPASQVLNKVLSLTSQTTFSGGLTTL